MDFEDILDVVPFLEYVAMGLQSADGAKEFRPRIFKTHGEYGESSKNHKVIVITRYTRHSLLCTAQKNCH